MLSMPSELGQPTRANLTHQSKGIGLFLKSVRKRFRELHFAWVRELSENRRLHLHLIWNVPWLDQTELSELAKKAGFGSVVHVRSFRRPGSSQVKAINYLTKELGAIETDPTGAWPPKTRRYQISAPVVKRKKHWKVGAAMTRFYCVKGSYSPSWETRILI